MAAKPELPTPEQEVARWRQESAQVDESLRASHGGQTPFTSEGQAIGYAETRRENFAADLGAATVKAAAADPETFTQDPERAPEVIEGTLKPSRHDGMMNLIRNKPKNT